MRGYYKLKLNCARTKINSDMSEENGFLNIGIEKLATRKGVALTEEDYVFCPEYLIAKKVGEHFEELFFGLKIDFDPNGIQDGMNSIDIKKYDITQLQDELIKGITCFEYSDAKPREVNNFMKNIQFSGATMKNYRDELKFVAEKKPLYTMIIKKQEERFKELSRVRKI